MPAMRRFTIPKETIDRLREFAAEERRHGILLAPLSKYLVVKQTLQHSKVPFPFQRRRVSIGRYIKKSLEHMLPERNGGCGFDCCREGYAHGYTERPLDRDLV